MSEENTLQLDEMGCKSVRVHFVRTKKFEEAFDNLKSYAETLELSKAKLSLLNRLTNDALKAAEQSGFKQGFEMGKDGIYIEFP